MSSMPVFPIGTVDMAMAVFAGMVCMTLYLVEIEPGEMMKACQFIIGRMIVLGPWQPPLVPDVVNDALALAEIAVADYQFSILTTLDNLQSSIGTKVVPDMERKQMIGILLI